MHATILFIIKYSYAGIFLSLSLGIIGLPIPDESLIAFAGFLSSQGKLSFPFLLPVVIMGTCLGITISYFLGKLSRRFVTNKYADRISVNSDHLQQVKIFYDKYGRYALLIGYFVPGVRHLTAFFAGMNYMPFGQFALYAYSGSFLWTGTFLTLGYWLGHEWHRVTHYSNHIFIPAVLVFSLVLFIGIYLKNRN